LEGNGGALSLVHSTQCQSNLLINTFKMNYAIKGIGGGLYFSKNTLIFGL